MSSDTGSEAKMNKEQILAIHEYLRENSPGVDLLEKYLHDAKRPFCDSVEETVLYIPLYSAFPRSASVWTPRIEWLRNNNWGVKEIAALDLSESGVEKIASGVMSDGSSFGSPKAVKYLIVRAKRISSYGVANLERELEMPENWTFQSVRKRINFLCDLGGIGEKAALHILMELRWDVVKPDMHICRFLSRLGGDWSRFFPEGEAEEVASHLLSEFLETWHKKCIDIRQATGWESRQVDMLIMFFTQGEEGLAPPLCTKNPECARCRVPNCKYGESAT
ncbi:MAG: hypothetical protein MPK06_02240 [Alphaproteobacteria bacterium]|nr:hypothetical protein [Alphaproteobacteria bacterium]MDA8005346.1 hypothetical protein [Alphaproteobacteria bacterium]